MCEQKIITDAICLRTYFGLKKYVTFKTSFVSNYVGHITENRICFEYITTRKYRHSYFGISCFFQGNKHVNVRVISLCFKYQI